MKANFAFIGIAALCISLVAVGSAAGTAGEGEFCGRAQQIIAGTSLVAKVVSHTDYQSFVESKASASPLTVQQYLSNPLSGEEGMPRVLSCKMKTAERINQAQPSPAGGAPAAQGDTSCQAVHRQLLSELLAGLADPHLALAGGELVIDEEELTFMGPMWLRPWPFQPLARDEQGRLHLQSRALYVPYSWWIPMPDRFKGTYYCHFIAPVYLEALLRGEVQPGL